MQRLDASSDKNRTVRNWNRARSRFGTLKTNAFFISFHLVRKARVENEKRTRETSKNMIFRFPKYFLWNIPHARHDAVSFHPLSTLSSTLHCLFFDVCFSFHVPLFFFVRHSSSSQISTQFFWYDFSIFVLFFFFSLRSRILRSFLRRHEMIDIPFLCVWWRQRFAC